MDCKVYNSKGEVLGTIEANSVEVACYMAETRFKTRDFKLEFIPVDMEEGVGIFYQSIPYYNHKVYKCCGRATNEVLTGGITHKEYYTEYFKTHRNCQSVSNEELDVIVLPQYLGDRIENGFIFCRGFEDKVIKKEA